MEDVEITLADQIQKVSKANFGAAWEEASESGQCELEDMFALSSMTSIEQAVSSVISFLGMQPAERSDKVPQGKSAHTLYLAGNLFILYLLSVFPLTLNFTNVHQQSLVLLIGYRTTLQGKPMSCIFTKSKIMIYSFQQCK